MSGGLWMHVEGCSCACLMPNICLGNERLNPCAPILPFTWLSVVPPPSHIPLETTVLSPSGSLGASALAKRGLCVSKDETRYHYKHVHLHVSMPRAVAQLSFDASARATPSG